MTTFYVGQRVKLYRPVHPFNLGKLGSIFAMGPLKMDQILCIAGELWRCPESADCIVDWEDGYGPGMCMFYQLIPHSEGHQPAELSVEELLPFLKAKRVQA